MRRMTHFSCVMLALPVLGLLACTDAQGLPQKRDGGPDTKSGFGGSTSTGSGGAGGRTSSTVASTGGTAGSASDAGRAPNPATGGNSGAGGSSSRDGGGFGWPDGSSFPNRPDALSLPDGFSIPSLGDARALPDGFSFPDVLGGLGEAGTIQECAASTANGSACSRGADTLCRTTDGVCLCLFGDSWTCL